eukprot:1637890-Prymnesium_polylepis.1
MAAAEAGLARHSGRLLLCVIAFGSLSEILRSVPRASWQRPKCCARPMLPPSGQSARKRSHFPHPH